MTYQSSLKVIEMEAQLKNLVFRDIGDGPWNTRPSFKSGSSDFSLSGFGDSFRASGSKAIKNSEWTHSTACLPHTATDASVGRSVLSLFHYQVVKRFFVSSC